MYALFFFLFPHPALTLVHSRGSEAWEGDACYGVIGREWWELAPVSTGFESMGVGEKCLWLSPSWLQPREGWGERLACGDTNFSHVGG